MAQVDDRPAGTGSIIWWAAGSAVVLMVAVIGWAVASRGGPPPPPGPGESILAHAVEPAGDVRSAEEAWRRAREIESGRDGTERERSAAALPYYLSVASARDAQGRYSTNSPEAALRIAEIIDRYARADNERLTGAKYFLVASGVFISAGKAREASVWRKAEGVYLRAGKHTELAETLAKFADNARIRAGELAASPDPLERQRAIELADLAVELSGRAGELVKVDK